MTRKEELLIFIETINEETEMLKTNERIITSNTDSTVINDYDLGTKTFRTTNANLSSLITGGFSDGLIGHVGTDPNEVEILSWVKVTKEIAI